MEKNKWFLDSGCSRHMTWNKKLFKSLRPKEKGFVNFGDNSKGKIIGIGTIGKGNISIDDVLLVDGLKHNLLSISQLCDKGHKVVFKHDICEVVNNASNDVVFVGYRHSNIYKVDLNCMTKDNLCLVSTNNDDCWLWHRRLGHTSMSIISKLSKRNLVKGLPPI